LLTQSLITCYEHYFFFFLDKLSCKMSSNKEVNLQPHDISSKTSPVVNNDNPNSLSKEELLSGANVQNSKQIIPSIQTPPVSLVSPSQSEPQLSANNLQMNRARSRQVQNGNIKLLRHSIPNKVIFERPQSGDESLLSRPDATLDFRKHSQPLDYYLNTEPIMAPDEEIYRKRSPVSLGPAVIPPSTNFEASTNDKVAQGGSKVESATISSDVVENDGSKFADILSKRDSVKPDSKLPTTYSERNNGKLPPPIITAGIDMAGNKEPPYSYLRNLPVIWKESNAPRSVSFFTLVISLEFFIIILIGIFTFYDDSIVDAHYPDSTSTNPNMGTFFNFYTEISFLAVIGYGYLRAGPVKYGYTAVCVGFLVWVLGFQCHILFYGFWQQLHLGFPEYKPLTFEAITANGSLANVTLPTSYSLYPTIPLNFRLLTSALLAGNTFSVSFGGLLGKVTPHQMVIIAIVEVFFYDLNLFITQLVLGAIEISGAVTLHFFAGTFGIFCSWIMSPEASKGDRKHMIPHENFRSSPDSNLFAFIGAALMWLYRPTFNSALSPYYVQHRVAMGTILGLFSSACMAFWTSKLLRGGKFFMPDVQNAIFAGGIAMASNVSLAVPAVAVCVGAWVGFQCVVGFVFIQPFLLRYLDLHDSGGIFSLHFMSGLTSGLCSIVVTGIVGSSLPSLFPHGGLQFAFEIALIAITFCLAAFSGCLTGLITRWFLPPLHFFEDSDEWILGGA